MEGSSLKQLLRAALRAQRRNLDASHRHHLDHRINQEVLDLVAREQANSLAAYLPFDGEPDLRPALEILSRRGVRVALPAVVVFSGVKRLEFRHWTPEVHLTHSPFGIDQPGAVDDVSLGELDLLLIPLVAWDEHGHRLGMGAGYYDRALAAVADSRRPLRIGVGYVLQKHADLPADPWDIRLHQVITEAGGFTCVP